MDYFKFNRQAIMTAEQRGDILMILNRNLFMNSSLRNDIYGLFDGYYYHGIATRTMTEKNILLEDQLKLTSIYFDIKKKSKK